MHEFLKPRPVAQRRCAHDDTLDACAQERIDDLLRTNPPADLDLEFR